MDLLLLKVNKACTAWLDPEFMNQLRIAIHQPNFMPWLGYFHKMSMVDIFVLLDDVQVPQGKSVASRALIKNNQGEFWISVPTSNKSAKMDYHNIEVVNNTNWKAKSLKTIKLAYQKAPFFNTYFEQFAAVYMTPHKNLFDLNFDLIVFLKNSLKLKAELRLSSQLATDLTLSGDKKILSILEKLSAKTYVSGSGAGSRRYINEVDFNAREIALVWQQFKSPEYMQLHGTFIPNLSAIDYLFNCGSAPQFQISHTVNSELS